MVILLEFNMCNSEVGEHLRCKSIPFVEGNMEYYMKFAYSLFLSIFFPQCGCTSLHGTVTQHNTITY